MSNYFNTLSLREQLAQLGQCRFMDTSEFTDGVEALKGLKIVIIGCGAQGLNQGLNMRDSGLNISYALRSGAIEQKRASYQNATSNNQEKGVTHPKDLSKKRQELKPQAQGTLTHSLTYSNPKVFLMHAGDLKRHVEFLGLTFQSPTPHKPRASVRPLEVKGPNS